MRSNISIPLFILASVDYALGSRRHHVHRYRARSHLMQHTEPMEPRAMAGTEAQHIPEETIVQVQTMTKTVFEDCSPTNTISVSTTLLGEWTPAQTHSKPTKPEPAPAQSEPTNSIQSHFETNHPQPTKPEPTTTILMTTTFTRTVTGTVTVSGSTTALSSSNLSGEERSMPDTTKADHAPQILPTLGDLPGDIPQLLTGVATAVPVPQLPLDQVLNPSGPDLPASLHWTSLPAKGGFSLKRFGGRSSPHGRRIKYRGNVGIPWGSNIISVSPIQAHRYKYVVQFRGSNTRPWRVTIWNKVGPDGKLDGWYGHSALTFVLAPGETRYVAFDEDSQGAWGAAPGTHGLPTDTWGGYTSTWGEFSFGDGENNGWSAWDVSAIQAQLAHQNVQGMRICRADGQDCSVITPGARKVAAAYTESTRHHDGIGGAAAPGPVRLVVDIDYRG